MSPVARLSEDVPNLPNGAPKAGWASDYLAVQLSKLHIPYIVMVPGSSYRGLHDSIVNLNGNATPEMVICLHEEHSVAIAHGYAKVTGKPLAIGLHANVGLMHASMAVFNAFIDRVPMVMIGATGPMDTTKRRPWIDSTHSAVDIASIVRNYVKWDDQPTSVNSAVRSLIKATAVTSVKPCAPTMVVLDVGLQESKVEESEVKMPDTERYLTQSSAGASQYDVKRVAEALKQSKKALFMFGRLDRTQKGWDERVKLAETFDAKVITDIKQPVSFPTTHRLHPAPPALFLAPDAAKLIREADLIISFDWVDLAGFFTAAGASEPSAKTIEITLDTMLHNGWSKDHFETPPADYSIFADPDKFISDLVEHLSSAKLEGFPNSSWPVTEPSSSLKELKLDDEEIFQGDLAAALYSVIKPEDMCIIRLPLSFRGGDLLATHPLAYLGMDGGAGIGSGPGQAVGSALALKDSPLVPVAILGDGDFLMGVNAIWTAPRYRIPVLIIVSNNASFFNDEVHQERVANARNRPAENKWIGMRLDDPLPDIGRISEGMGLKTVGPQIRDRSELKGKLEEAIKRVRAGESVVVDIRVMPYDYGSSFDGKGSSMKRK
ncbi:acetolactate synthase II [Xylogone sp. PMI_703]|nr:acetolactate synthase II [Xylogone sp. PMI_703]